jgi:hypothetical protein
MKQPRIALALILLCTSPGSAAALLSRQAAIETLAQLHAWGDLCRNWTEDGDAVAAFMLSQEIVTDDRYAAIYGPAREKAESAATRSGDSREACSKAVEWFGPNGSKVRNLLTLKEIH